MTLLEEFQHLRAQVDAQQTTIDELRTRLTVVEIEAVELKRMRKAAWWIGGLIVAGAIGFGFSVLVLIPPG